MAAPNQTAPCQCYCFGDFLLDTGARSLTSRNETIPLTLKEFDTLVVLVESAGQAVEKEFLISRVWPDSFVGDGSLAKNISILRKHIGAEAIQTVPKHGYRFAAPVSLASTPVRIPENRIVEPKDTDLRLIAPPPSLARSRRAWLVGAGVVCIVLLLAAPAVLRWHLWSAELANQNPARVAVLPFRNLSAASGNDYFSDGIAEELITALGQIDGERLRVLANGSSGEYKATNKSLLRVAKELNVQFLLQGTVALQNKQVDVNVHLVRAADQSVMWAAKYSRPIAELPRIQTEITESIAREVEARLLPDAVSSRQRQTLDPLAYDAYLHGRMDLEHKNPAASQKALEEFRQVTVLDSKYAPAYAGIAETYINLAGNTPTQAAYAYAKEAALTAIRLDEHLAEAHRDLAWILDNNESDRPGARREYQRALQLNPSDARSHHWFAQYLVAQQQPQEALREAKTGLDLDPISLSSNYNYAFMLIEAGQYDAAIAHLEHLRLREPENEVVYGYLGIAYDRKHLEEKSAESFQRAADLSGLHKQYEANVARSLALAGKTANARAIVSRLQGEMDRGIWMPAVNLSLAYFALGDQPRGFSLLRKALQEHSCTAIELDYEPMFVAQKSDPRLVALRDQFHLRGPFESAPDSSTGHAESR
ncbi:MAG TPA: FlgO family outer membrane protein [Candidatus Sulfotelmatobacter sp.]|jgi:serine/threonine-protein kinase